MVTLRTLFISALFLTLPALTVADETKVVKRETAKETPKQQQKKQAEEQPSPTVKLESVFVGDKEQPAISYFIPWQGIGTPDKLHWNVEEKYDKALDLVDRDIMLRSIHFYEEMQLENPATTDPQQ